MAKKTPLQSALARHAAGKPDRDAKVVSDTMRLHRAASMVERAGHKTRASEMRREAAEKLVDQSKREKTRKARILEEHGKFAQAADVHRKAGNTSSANRADTMHSMKRVTVTGRNEGQHMRAEKAGKVGTKVRGARVGLQHGKRGGSFYLGDHGNKIYVKKR